MCYVENEDVVGAAPTGDAPTTSELSINNFIANKVRLISKVYGSFAWYMINNSCSNFGEDLVNLLLQLDMDSYKP